MIKSLYVRVILTFIGAVLLGSILSLILISRLYQDQIKSYLQDEYIARGKEMIQYYTEAYPDRTEALMKGLMVSSFNAVNIYGSDGKLLHENLLTDDNRIPLDREQVDYVLKGGVYRETSAPGPRSLLIGLPFQIGNEKYALFLAPVLGPFLKLVAGLFNMELLIVLLFGSLFILIAARFIVNPLKQLTLATKRMSKGDFRIALRTKRKDEIGQLTRSFNAMAKELGMLEKIRQQFVSNVSHEIQSPLTSIRGFTQALKQKQLDEAGRMRLLSIIEEESGRLSRLSENLLQLSSLEYEHLELQRSRFRLDEQIRKVVIAQEPQWAAKQIRIELKLEELGIDADEDKLYQLWSNLFGNAVKFTGPSGEIRIAAGRNGNTAVVSVQDTGPGIPEGDQDHIFRPFYKVDESRTRAVEGNGIGLSIARRVVDLHHGDIQVRSKPGEGTTFTVILPIEPPQQAEMSSVLHSGDK